MDVRQTLLTIEQELNQVHFERQEVIRGLLVALLARQHVILLGPPGTGKSRLARDLCQRVQGRFFEWQLTRMSTPEELFGPISLQGLQQDRYRRIPAGKLPEADIAYLDETFKASSAILNTLLAAMNERLFFNDGQAVPMPLEMLIGASNELPEDREELGALWDRFLLRYVVDYVRTPAAFQALLGVPVTPPVPTTLPLAVLAQAQTAVAQVDPRPVLGLLATLRQELAKAGLVDLGLDGWAQEVEKAFRAYDDSYNESTQTLYPFMVTITVRNPDHIWNGEHCYTIWDVSVK